MIRTFKYPLKVNKAQEQKLVHILLQCQRLYNAALMQRVEAYKKQRVHVNYYMQTKDLTDLRLEDESFGKIATVILRSPLSNLDKTFKGYFRRLKCGQKPGFPRFKAKNRYNTFSWLEPSFIGDLVKVPKLGYIKFHKYRDIKGIPKEVRISKTYKGWVLSIVCDLGLSPKKVTVTTSVGIDMGITNLVTVSNGTHIDNPKYYKNSQEILANRQRNLQTKKKGSNNRFKAKKLVAKAYEKVRNQRLDYLRKIAKILVVQYDLIAYEELKISNMVKHPTLAKSINDASWGILINCINYKAEEAGKTTIAVNPHNTSQKCSNCGTLCPKDLSVRIHSCNTCGLVLDRDHNAAINIHRLGLSLVEQGNTL